MELIDETKHWDLIYNSSLDKIPWLESELPVGILELFYMNLQEPKLVLDFACGNGRIAKWLLGKKCEITCIDISKHAIDLCRINLNNSSVKYIISKDLPNIIYNGIISWGLFHHLNPKDWSAYLQKFYNNVSKDGIVLIGGFDLSDVNFNGKSRISPTTKMMTYALTNNFLQKKFVNTGFFLIETGTIKFIDGNTINTRTFRYYLLKK